MKEILRSQIALLFAGRSQGHAPTVWLKQRKRLAFRLITPRSWLVFLLLIGARNPGREVQERSPFVDKSINRLLDQEGGCVEMHNLQPGRFATELQRNVFRMLFGSLSNAKGIA